MPDDPTPPLYRHASLQPLSREHMGGLVQARALRMAASGNEEARHGAALRFLNAWVSEISGHFDDEERRLLPLIGEPALADRLLGDHRRLRDLAARCAAGEHDAALLAELASLLHEHIRWEERTLFESIQREHGDALQRLARHAAEIEERRPGSRPRHRLDDRAR